MTHPSDRPPLRREDRAAPQDRARPGGPAPRLPGGLTVAGLARALRLAHGGYRVAPLLPGQPAGTATWVYRDVLTGGQWLRRQRLDVSDRSPGAPTDRSPGIAVPAAHELAAGAAEDLVRVAVAAGWLRFWVRVDAGPVHGCWEFAPEHRGALFDGVDGSTAAWRRPGDPRPTVTVDLAGRWLAAPWLVEDDVARPVRVDRRAGR